MPRKRSLNGLPHNLAASFFSTLRYYKCGYMEDWLWNGAKRLNINQATLDILDASVLPEALNIYPLIYNLRDLKKIIEKELATKNFPPDYIYNAKIVVDFFNSDLPIPKLSFYSNLINKEGYRYESKKFFVNASFDGFDPFDEKNLFPNHNHRYI